MSEQETRARLPPGQVRTQKWPVLTYGETPRVDLGTWTFRCFGLVEQEVSWTWEEFGRLPRVEVRSDVHCVTRWSRFDNLWAGVSVREILARVRLRPGVVAVRAMPIPAAQPTSRWPTCGRMTCSWPSSTTAWS